MMPASNKGVGMNTGFPDVCLTPPPAPVGPYPIPYPNLSMNAQASTFSPNVFTGFMQAMFIASISPMTSGDDAGRLNPLCKMAGGYTMGNPVVFVNCMPAINMLCTSWGNAMNCPVGAALVPSVTTTLYTDRQAAAGASADGTLSLEAVRALSSAARDGRNEQGAPVVEGRPLAPGVFLVSLRRFPIDVSTRVYNALRQAEAGDVVLIDLRENPGGDADAALELADEFVARGTPLAVVDEADDVTLVEARHDASYDQRLVVLVDGQTASAAELFAGALQAAGRATIVGARTFGKSTAQRLVPPSGGEGAGYATVARYRLPSGRPIDGRGLEPDVSVPADADPLERALASL